MAGNHLYNTNKLIENEEKNMSVFYPLYKKGGFGGPSKFHHEFLAFFWSILTIKIAVFF